MIQATIRYFALEQNIFFSKFKIDKYEFITKIGKIEKVKKKIKFSDFHFNIF